MPKERRYITRFPNSLSCSLCPSKGKIVGNGPFLGLVAITFYRFHLLFCKCKSFCLDFDYSCAYAVGDGGSRGAGFSHAAAGVLRRSTELSFSPALRERRNPRAHHQTLQVIWISGQQFAQIYFSHFSQQGLMLGKRKYVLFYFRSIKVMWMILGTLTMLGWRQLLSTSMMNQVSVMWKCF